MGRTNRSRKRKDQMNRVKRERNAKKELLRLKKTLGLLDENGIEILKKVTTIADVKTPEEIKNVCIYLFSICIIKFFRVFNFKGFIYNSILHSQFTSQITT